MNEDWLDTGEVVATAGLPVVVAVPTDIVERVRIVEDCWSRLTIGQKTFLTAWRENRFNARAAARAIGLSTNTYPMVPGMRNPDFATVVQIWRATAASEALDRDRLLVRQEDIIETLLTPKPVLHQGIPVIVDGVVLYEVEAGAAGKANEALLDRVMPKPHADVEVNVGVAFTPPSVEVQKPRDAIDAKVEVVEASPQLPDESWLS